MPTCAPARPANTPVASRPSAPPPTRAPVRGRDRWVAHVDAAARRSRLTCRGHTAVTAVARVLADCARGDRSSAPTWQRLTQRTGLSRATVARWLAWLRSRHLLTTIEHGSTPQTRHDGSSHDGNRAAVYRLTDPAAATPATGNPPRPGRHQPATGPTVTGPTAVTSRWPAAATTRTRKDELAAAAELRRRVPALRRVSDRETRSVVRTYLRRGYTINDLAYAIDHRPDGRPWTHTDTPRRPARWLAWRLAAWTAHPPRHAALADAAARLRAQQEADRTRWAAARAAARPAPPWFTAARQRLTGRTGSRTARVPGLTDRWRTR